MNIRLKEHILGKKSNKALQLALTKYGIENFRFEVYMYYKYDIRETSHKSLTDLETLYIQAFPFDELYNYMKTATSLEGYKHTLSAKTKMVARFKDKSNHPFWGSHHSEESKKKISKPGELNPMYGKKHSKKTKELISLQKNKHKHGVGIYDNIGVLIHSFKNNIELGAYLGITKGTVGRYLKSGKVYKGKYIFKVNKGPEK